MGGDGKVILLSLILNLKKWIPQQFSDQDFHSGSSGGQKGYQNWLVELNNC
jgi:hypothetical protein